MKNILSVVACLMLAVSSLLADGFIQGSTSGGGTTGTASYATNAGTATAVNSTYTLRVNNIIGTDVTVRQTNAPYFSLFCATTNSLPGDTIVIDPGCYLFETNVNGAVANGILMMTNTTLIAYGANVAFSNGFSTTTCLILRDNCKVYGGTYTNCWYTGLTQNSALIGLFTFPATNAYVQDANLYSQCAGVEVKISGNLRCENCYVNAGYVDFGLIGATSSSVLEADNCIAISTNICLTTVNDWRSGFKVATSATGTMIANNCQVVVGDSGTSVPSYGISSKVSTLAANQFRINNVTIDTTQCSNPLSADIGIAGTVANIADFFNVARTDGNALSITNLSNPGTSVITWLQTYHAGNGSGLTNIVHLKTLSSANETYVFTQNTDGSSNAAITISSVPLGALPAVVVTNSGTASVPTNTANFNQTTNDFVMGKVNLGPAQRFSVMGLVSEAGSVSTAHAAVLVYSNAATGVIQIADRWSVPEGVVLTLTNKLGPVIMQPNSLYWFTNDASQNAAWIPGSASLTAW